MVLSAAAGELTLTDRSGECSDGDDIFTANFSLSKHPVTLNCLFLLHRTTICASLLDAAADVGVDVFAAVDATTLSSTFLHPYCTTNPWLPEIISNKAWTSSKLASASKSLNPSKQCTPSLKIVRWSFTRQSSHASFGTPRHNSSPVLVVPRYGSETTCEGRRGCYPATQTAAATSEILAETSQSWYRLFTQTGSCP